MKTYMETTERILEKSAALTAQRTKCRRIVTGACTAVCCMGLCIFAAEYALGRPPVIGIDPMLSAEASPAETSSATVTEIAPINEPCGLPHTVTTVPVLYEPTATSAGEAISVPPEAAPSQTSVSSAPAVPPMTSTAPAVTGGYLEEASHGVMLWVDHLRAMTRDEELAYYGITCGFEKTLGLAQSNGSEGYGYFEHPELGEYYALPLRWNDGDRYLCIRPLHGRLPHTSCHVVGEPEPAFTVADGEQTIKVYESVSWNGSAYYWTQFMHGDVGFDVAAQYLTEAEFRIVLAELLC